MLIIELVGIFIIGAFVGYWSQYRYLGKIFTSLCWLCIGITLYYSPSTPTEMFKINYWWLKMIITMIGYIWGYVFLDK